MVEKKERFKNQKLTGVGTRKRGTSPWLSANEMQIIRLLDTQKQGLTSRLILKLLPMTKRTMYRCLNSLEKMQLLKHKKPLWYPVVYPKTWHYFLHKKINVQLHAFSIQLQLIKKPYWWERRSNKIFKFKDLRSDTIQLRNHSYTEFFYQNYIVRCFPNSLLFISQKQYWAADAFTCLQQGIEDVFKILEYMAARFKFNFLLDGVPHLTIKSNHYVMLKDATAKVCKQVGKGFHVHINNELRAVVDFSDPLGLELVHMNYGAEDAEFLGRCTQDLLMRRETYSDMERKLQDQIDSLKSELKDLRG